MSSESPIWRIKYMPNTLNEICGRDDIKKRLKTIISEQNFPHLLFMGAEGIGKTTIAYLFSKEFLGHHFDANFKIIYADVPLTEEERRQARSESYISTNKIGSSAGKTFTAPAFIQIKVKPFVQLKAIGDAPFKILVVKNFHMLENQQQGFRRLMETYGNNCRMILITTRISRIIDPILSRCQIFLISQAEFKAFKDLILNICEKESLNIEDKALKILYKASYGKIGDAIDLLQLCSISSDDITLKALYENIQVYRTDLIKSLLMLCLKGNFNKARELARKIYSNYKYSAQDLFVLILKEIEKFPLSRYAKIQLINFIADSDFRAIDGRDDDIQISALLSKICLFSEYL
ncbi:MAG: AAA family ATPase [Promethearchaeota archaeon]